MRESVSGGRGAAPGGAPGEAFGGRVRRPHRLNVNIDAETLEALNVLSFASGMSRSSVASDVLRLLVPVVAPMLESIGRMRYEPGKVMERMAVQARMVAEATDAALAGARVSTPPPTNRGECR